MAATDPPRSRGWPLLGSVPALMTGGMDHLDARREALGDLYRIQIGPMPVVLLYHPDHARHVLLEKEANYAKQGTFWSSVRSLIGLGLPTIEGDTWRSRRKMMNPQFKRQRLTALATPMVDAIEERLDTWSAGEAKVGDDVSSITMAVIVRTMFGTGMTPEESDTVSEAMSFSLNHMLQKVMTDAFPAWIPMPGRAAHREAVAQIDAILYKLIERRRAEGGGDDLLTMLLEMRDEDDGTGLTDEQLRDETMSLFIAGYETTASAVSAVCRRMAEDPALWESVREEVDRVLGDRRPTPDDLPELDLVGRVFLEALRTDGPVYFLAREAVDDDELGGHHIAAGTQVSLMLDRIHRHPEFWPDPDRFDPDRFLPENTKGRHPCAYLPFGSGRRHCIGRHFAVMEGSFLIAMIVQRVQFAPVEGQQPTAEYALTRRPKDGLPLEVVPRR